MPGTIHISPELAARAEALFLELGLDLDTAVSLFLRQSLRDQGLPFTPRLSTTASANPDTQGARPEQVDAVPVEPVLEPSHEPVLELEEQPDEPKKASLPEPETCETPEPHTPEDDEAAPAADEQQARPAFFDDIPEENTHSLSELRQAFLNMQLIGTPLRRIRTLNQLYAIGEPNGHVHGWREVYVSGDEPFALDFGAIRVELGYHGGGSLRMMDGRLPDEVLEADAVFPRDLSAVFSSVIGQRLTDVSSGRVPGGEAEQLRLRFANGCTLVFMPGAEWGALWLMDAHGSVLYAPDTVWRRVLGERTWQRLL